MSEASPEKLRMQVYPELDRRLDATILPLLLKIGETAKEVSVEMEPLRTVFVELLDEQGTPVKATEVTVSYYAYFHGGTLGMVTCKALIAAREGKAFDINHQNVHRQFPTDAKGIATIPDFSGSHIFVRLWGSDRVDGKMVARDKLVDDKVTIKIRKSGK